MNGKTLRRSIGTLGCVLALSAGTVGATLLVGAVPAGAATATQKIIVRPVNSHRRAVKGYRVVKWTSSVSCTSTAAAAIDNGIAFCGSSADYTVACWHSSDAARVLCLPDPQTKVLWSVKLVGTFPKLRAPAHPRPQALELNNGDRYLVRDGGAATALTQHPNWVAYYYGGRQTIGSIYGPRGSHGINTHHARWFVTTFRTAKSHGVRHDVARAYYVGTAS